MIEVKKLKKVFKTQAGDFVALENIGFKILTGQFVSIVGRSGSGKSTLLYQMSLLDRPTEGSIVIDDRETVHLSTEQRTDFRLNTLGYVFQDYALIPTLTAKENVAVPLIMKGLSNKEAYDVALGALESVGLLDKAENIPARLSGGQQQRVSIARGIAAKPKILFADEPTANLDIESSEQVLEVFEKLNKTGLTIVMVTHEMEYAKRTHRVITLSDGEVIADHTNKKQKTTA
jgi:putative ABC transport system ATP-binding protein